MKIFKIDWLSNEVNSLKHFAHILIFVQEFTCVGTHLCASYKTRKFSKVFIFAIFMKLH